MLRRRAIQPPAARAIKAAMPNSHAPMTTSSKARRAPKGRGFGLEDLIFAFEISGAELASRVNADCGGNGTTGAARLTAGGASTAIRHAGRLKRAIGSKAIAQNAPVQTRYREDAVARRMSATATPA